MELIVISDSKFKLMLTSSDMASYTGNTKEILREIINDAQTKCGYAPISGRVFIQMYPSREGGCELFVTKLEHHDNIKMHRGEERALAEYKKYIPKEKRIIYSFDEMSYLLGCCYGLWQTGYLGASTAYVDRDRHNYYLMLDNETHIAGENMGSLCPGYTYYYINEHCDVICGEQAAEKLGRLA
ncbi:MAG: adaptor protein MecA [Ruminococcaceae bacterium]|nr:adaptor protein MecA [Oscillospiraceae bacterium]